MTGERPRPSPWRRWRTAVKDAADQRAFDEWKRRVAARERRAQEEGR